MKIIVCEYLHADGVSLMEAAGHSVFYDLALHERRDELRTRLADTDALLVRNQTLVDSELTAGAAGLKVVGRLGVGLDNINIPDMNERGIIVTWAPGSNAVSVAEYVLGAILELSRSFPKFSAMVHGGTWDRQAFMGSEVSGKTLGIVGLGDIGGRTARRAAAFGMRVLANDPFLNDSSAAVGENGVELTTLADLLARSDFVSLHAPLVDGTRRLMNAETLSRMKPGAYLINTARGGLVDEAALVNALASGALAGAVLDVRDPEPPGPDDPMRGLENVMLTPHIAGVSFEANRRVSMHVASDVLNVLAGDAPVSRAPGSV